MFKPMRRKDRQVSDETAMRILKEGEYGVLSAVGSNGYPTGIPFNYVLKDDCIYVHAARGYTVESVVEKPQVSFTVVNMSRVIAKEFVTDYESAVVYGTASIAVDDKYEGLRLLVEKYSGSYMEAGEKHIAEDINNCEVIRIHIDHLTGKVRNGG